VEGSAAFGAENHGLGIVEGSVPNKSEEPTSRVSKKEPEMWEHRTLGRVLPPPLEREKRRKPLDDGENLD
jgi:hypothetical protein